MVLMHDRKAVAALHEPPPVETGHLSTRLDAVIVGRMGKWVWRFYWLMSLELVLVTPAFARPTQVILLRHAEKPADESDVHLSDRGRERARALVNFFTATPALTNTGLPTVLYATRMTRTGKSQRPRETLEPLAKHLRLTIQTPFLAADYAALARHVLTSPACDGKTVVLCWVHEYLPELAAAFGIKPVPRSWKSGVFDRVWVIHWKEERPELQIVPQRLLVGDTKR